MTYMVTDIKENALSFYRFYVISLLMVNSLHFQNFKISQNTSFSKGLFADIFLIFPS